MQKFSTEGNQETVLPANAGKSDFGKEDTRIVHGLPAHRKDNMVNQPNPKTAVGLIRDAFKERGSDIKTKEAYNLLAQLWGYKDWPTATAHLDTRSRAPAPKVYARSDTEIDSWPVWVFCNKGGSEDEPLYVYPYGTKLDDLYASRRHWHLIDEKDLFAIQVPDDVPSEEECRQLQELFVGEEVACAYPDADEYGFPACANEREVHAFLQEELGWGYRAMPSGMPLVSVTSSCRGDDGPVEWWIQARVHPSVHKKLLAATKPGVTAFERAASEVALQEFLASTEGSWTSAREIMANLIASWFDAVNSWTLEELRRLLSGYSETASLSDVFSERGDVRGKEFVLKKGREAATAGELSKALNEAWASARQSI